MTKLVRQTIQLTETGHERLKALGKAYDVRMYQILDALLRQAEIDDPRLIAALEEVRQEIGAEKQRMKRIKELAKTADPEKLEAMLRQSQ